LNRSAVEEIEFDHSHISGGISKINTADNVFGIFTSRAMKERGRYQLQLMKTRSSSGVGQKVELEFDMNTLRIQDAGEDAQQSNQPRSSEIMNRIKSNATVSGARVDASTGEILEDAPKISADVQSNKLKQLLAQIKTV
jgi:hypothetical protein